MQGVTSPKIPANLCAMHADRMSEKVGAAVCNCTRNAVVNFIANHQGHGAVRPCDQAGIGFLDVVPLLILDVSPADAVFSLLIGEDRFAGGPLKNASVKKKFKHREEKTPNRTRSLMRRRPVSSNAASRLFLFASYSLLYSSGSHGLRRRVQEVMKASESTRKE